jgi:hypothetical protein
VNKSLQPRGSSGGHFEAGGGAAREHIFDADRTRELHGSAQPGGWNGGCPEAAGEHVLDDRKAHAVNEF